MVKGLWLGLGFGSVRVRVKTSCGRRWGRVRECIQALKCPVAKVSFIDSRIINLKPTYRVGCDFGQFITWTSYKRIWPHRRKEKDTSTC